MEILMTLVEQINDGIKEAMKNRNQTRLDALRMIKSKILLADARGNLPDSEVQKLLKTYLGSLHEAYDQAQAVKRSEIADKLKVEMSIVQEFLPKALSHEETKAIVQQAIADSGAKTKKDLGFVMKSVMKINSSVDGKVAKDLASELLSD